jgi:hypothetical protein
LDKCKRFLVELATSKTAKWHHQKWIILSVHHAASCMVSLWLRTAHGKHSLFGQNGKEAYPHLNEAINALQKYKGTKHLTDAESELLVLLNRLNDIRNKFMHRLPPKEINKEVVAYAATSMVGLRLSKRYWRIKGMYMNSLNVQVVEHEP